jgi:hypothetical protein
MYTGLKEEHKMLNSFFEAAKKDLTLMPQLNAARTLYELCAELSCVWAAIF